jgi:hypothetical protein
MVFGLMLALGYLLLGDTQHTLIAAAVAVVGSISALGALRKTLRSGTA